eukprot:13813912-Ditylum_brightwellii.AAC.1
MAWMPPSMPAIKPENSWSAPHATFTSSPLMKRIHLPTSLRRIPLIPTGQVPGHLSIPIKQDKTTAQITSHLGKELPIQQANLAKVSLSL